MHHDTGVVPLLPEEVSLGIPCLKEQFPVCVCVGGGALMLRFHVLACAVCTGCPCHARPVWPGGALVPREFLGLTKVDTLRGHFACVAPGDCHPGSPG